MIETALIAIIVVALLGFMVWRDFFWAKQVDQLTSKIMAGDYRGYAVFQNKGQIQPKKEQEKRVVVRDPVLGTVF